MKHVSVTVIKVPKQPIKRKCDPVSLYHYYTALWEKYKPNVPGENNWSDLRWNIRQKMVGNVVSQTSSRVRHYYFYSYICLAGMVIGIEYIER